MSSWGRYEEQLDAINVCSYCLCAARGGLFVCVVHASQGLDLLPGTQ